MIISNSHTESNLYNLKIGRIDIDENFNIDELFNAI